MQIRNIRRLCKTDLDKYLKDDYLLDLAKPELEKENELIKFGCNNWLLNSAPKRLIYDYMYGDLLNHRKESKKLKILDIGGGIILPQKIIASNHNLTVIDLLAHDNKIFAKKFSEKNNINLIEDDWLNEVSKGVKYDLVIANDIFPNVDQRLDIFFEIIKNLSKNIRILLTYHQSNKFYKVKRIDAEEIMYINSWDEKDILYSLHKNSILPSNSQKESIKKKLPSLYSNGRSIVYLDLKF